MQASLELYTIQSHMAAFACQNHSPPSLDGLMCRKRLPDNPKYGFILPMPCMCELQDALLVLTPTSCC